MRGIPDTVPPGYMTAHRLYKSWAVFGVGVEAFRYRLKKLKVKSVSVCGVTYWKPSSEDKLRLLEIKMRRSPVSKERHGRQMRCGIIAVRTNDMAKKLEMLRPLEGRNVTIRDFTGKLELMTDGLVAVVTATNGAFKSWLVASLGLNEIRKEEPCK